LCDAKSGPVRSKSFDALSLPFIPLARRVRDASGDARDFRVREHPGNKTAEKKRFRKNASAMRTISALCAARDERIAGRVARSASATRAGKFFARGC